MGLAHALRTVGKTLTGLALMLALVILAAALFAATTQGGSRRVVFVGGYSTMVVLGGSMEPTFRVGSVLFVRRVSAEEVRVGDVISFQTPTEDSREPGSITTHRVTSIDMTGGTARFHTKGDANRVEDRWVVSSDAVLGSASFAIPYLGYLSSFVRTRLGLLTLVVLPASLIVILEIGSIGKTVRERHSVPRAGSELREDTE
jgi:signal peptidase